MITCRIYKISILLLSLQLISFSQEWHTYTTGNSPLPCNWVLSLAKEPDNTIWAGTFSNPSAGVGGTVKITGNGWTVFDTSNSGIRNNSAISIVIDNNNNKWFGCSLRFDAFTSTVLDSGGTSRLTGSSWSNWIFNNFYSDNIQDMALNTVNNNIWTVIGTFFLQGSPIHGTMARFNGSTWNFFNRAFFNLPNNNSFRSVTVDNSGITWIGTINNGLIRFDGANFTIFNTGNSQVPSNNIYDLEIAPDGKLWVGTDFGLGKFDGTNWTVYRTSNSGLTYNVITAIAFEGSTTWVGTLNSLMKFDGTNWTKFDTANSQIPGGVVDVILVDNLANKWLGTRDFALAYGLTVFKEGGITGLTNTGLNIPEKYYLRQNYPNPFNPVTNIEFELPEDSYTTLKIYNSLGDEIAELISSRLNKGAYSYDWDGFSSPSGIYFYTLESGNFRETKKMILLK